MAEKMSGLLREAALPLASIAMKLMLPGMVWAMAGFGIANSMPQFQIVRVFLIPLRS